MIFYDAFGILFLMLIGTIILLLPLATAGLLVELTYRIRILFHRKDARLALNFERLNVESLNVRTSNVKRLNV